jgi:VanZ family protein
LTAQFYKTAEEKYEEQLRTLGHIISACTLGLLSFAAGLLIGVFILFH